MTSLTQIFLLRHGETEWNVERRIQGHSESSLTELGVAQAGARAAEMATLGLDAVYSSTSLRARQTTDAVLGSATESVIYRDELRELCMGIWEGQLRDDIARDDAETYDLYQRNPAAFQLEGAETFAEMQQRGVQAIEDIAAAHEGKEVLVVSHGAIIKACILHWLGLPLDRMWLQPSISNCSISQLNVAAGEKPTVVTIADKPVEQFGDFESLGEAYV